jgi:hypothetical protein
LFLGLFDPWVVLDLLQLHPLLWIVNQDAIDEVLGLWRYLGPNLVIEVVIALFNHLEQNKVIVLVKGWSP